VVEGSITAVKWTCFSNMEAPKFGLEVLGFDVEVSNPSQTGQSSTSVPDFISTQLTELHPRDLSYRNPSPLSPTWRRLCKIHKEMHDQGFFSFEDDSCLSTTESICFIGI
jgi:hypothetical protein